MKTHGTMAKNLGVVEQDKRVVAGKLAKIRTLLLEVRAYKIDDTLQKNVEFIDAGVIAAMGNIGYTSSFGKNHSIRAKRQTS